MQNNSNPVLMPGEPPVALTPAEQKQIREALCAVAARGVRYNGELTDMRLRLTHEFGQLKSGCALAQKVKA
jgi:tRNA G26 N,N-dimethylase Trm1